MKVVLKKCDDGSTAIETETPGGVWMVDYDWATQLESFKDFREVVLDLPLLKACRTFGFEVSEDPK
jgi:hypothetical protein